MVHRASLGSGSKRIRSVSSVEMLRSNRCLRVCRPPLAVLQRHGGPASNHDDDREAAESLREGRCGGKTLGYYATWPLLVTDKAGHDRPIAEGHTLWEADIITVLLIRRPLE